MRTSIIERRHKCPEYFLLPNQLLSIKSYILLPKRRCNKRYDRSESARVFPVQKLWSYIKDGEYVPCQALEGKVDPSGL
jgi:hypothetical protein